jgi:ABC-2 type transport system permease protein
VDIMVAALAFCALGIAVSTLIPNMDAGPAIVNLPYFILVFISGTYFPVTGTLGHVANYFPLRPFILAMYRCFDPTNRASLWPAHDLLTVVIWGVVGAYLAARHMRWSPNRG